MDSDNNNDEWMAMTVVTNGGSRWWKQRGTQGTALSCRHFASRAAATWAQTSFIDNMELCRSAQGTWTYVLGNSKRAWYERTSPQGTWQRIE
eukprot:15451111-Alexandrium_andersonii.AAC.1